MRIHARHQPIRGSSLIDLLFAMAIISVLAAVAIFNVSSSIGSSTVVKSRRNAQSICQLYQSARSVGATFTSTTKEGILEELIAGKQGSGAFATSVFQLELGGAEKAAALAFCSFDRAADMMCFRPARRKS